MRNHPLQKLPTEHFQGKRENGKSKSGTFYGTPTPKALTRDGVAEKDKRPKIKSQNEQNPEKLET